MYHGCGDVDHCGEAGVGFVGPQGDAFELLELAEEVFDQVTPFVHLGVDRERLQAARMLQAWYSSIARVVPAAADS